MLGACTMDGHGYVAGDVHRRSELETRPDAAALKIAEQAAVAPAQAGPANGLPEAGAAVVQSPEVVNAERPFSSDPIEAMRPFVLKTDGADRLRAEQCLAQAVYYEAAREPLKGQQAVAQVVLNRVRHPAYPKSVCGVVYQGAARATGCQFTFTCNGALRTSPDAELWKRAMAVARRALDGYVDADVGSATSYHAVYVAPYWAPTLVKMTQVGAHIFYRWHGGWGEPAAFVGHYTGRELLTPAVLHSGDPRADELQAAAPATRKVTLGAGAEARTYTVAAAAAPGAARPGARGVLQLATRQPTLSEVRAINQHLEDVEAHLAPAVTSAIKPSAAPAPTQVAALSAGDAGTPAAAIAPAVAAP